MRDLVLVIDFMNYVHRGLVGNLKGEYVLVYHFFKNLRATVEQFKPKKVFIALEGHPKHRLALYSEYKANRLIKTAKAIKKKQDIHKSADVIRNLLRYLPVTLLSHPNFEADDVIGTWCENLKDENVIIISNDSDYLQLLQKGYTSCSIFNPFTKSFMENPPYPYIAWKSLNGDESDNIPSLVTPKKVLDYLLNPSKLDEFLSVEENRANFNINRQLIEFISIPEDELIVSEGDSDFDSLKNSFEMMEFKSLINDNAWEKFVSTFDCIAY